MNGFGAFRGNDNTWRISNPLKNLRGLTDFEAGLPKAQVAGVLFNGSVGCIRADFRMGRKSAHPTEDTGFFVGKTVFLVLKTASLLLSGRHFSMKIGVF